LILILLLIVFALAAAVVLIGAATRPSAFTVQRSITIDAPPEKIFPLIDDFHNWPRWAPQDQENPLLARTYSGAERGLGAISHWHGIGPSGRGQMKIVHSVEPTTVTVQADFVKPFEAHNLNTFTLTPAGTATTVTWTMQGIHRYPMKLTGVFTDLDKLMGAHFEAGLETLRAAVQSQP
jgi:uncharacterized protein YndB with AHSA1/START domain